MAKSSRDIGVVPWNFGEVTPVGKYLLMGSLRFIFPAPIFRARSVPVKTLVTDPISKRVVALGVTLPPIWVAP